MAKKKKGRRIIRRARGLMTTKTGRVIVDSSIIGISLVGSTGAINMLPMIKQLPNWGKTIVQAGSGLLIGIFPGALAKKIGAGFVIGSIVTLTLPLAKKFLPDVSFFGRRNLNPDQVRKMQQMGMPVDVASQMGKPVTVSGNRTRY